MESTLKMILNLLCLLMILLLTDGAQSASSANSMRLCVIKNLIRNEPEIEMLAFGEIRFGTDFHVELSYGTSTSSLPEWSLWKSLGVPLAGSAYSNPARGYTTQNQTQVFVQAAGNGQVYTSVQSLTDPLTFSAWTRVGQNKLPSQSTPTALTDSVSLGVYGGETLVFTRSMSSNNSQLYWCKGNSTGFGSWNLLGGSNAILGTDATIIKNPWVDKYEAFMISLTGKIHRTWQHNANSFADWRSMSYAPSFVPTTKPVAQVMGYSIFNGKLCLMGFGTDGYAHQVSQSTCDTVDNPWGYCTWGSWSKMANAVPVSHSDVPNNLMASRNVHFGVALFTVNIKTGQLWQLWQMERGFPWNDWEKVPSGSSGAIFTSLPYLHLNDGGWWSAYGLNSTNQVIAVEPARSMNVSPGNVAWGENLTVSWSIAVSEATHEDWVGIYPKGAGNDQYVDYRYVQGGLNPGKKPEPDGSVNLISYLPDGTYDVCYLVNKKYVSIVGKSVAYYNQSTASELLQLYQGIFTGLGVLNKGIEACVDEGATTVQKFQEAFQAFEKKEVYEGLELLGAALEDLAITLRKCEEASLAQELEKFIKDLRSCVDGDCTAFLIDLADEIVILYMKEYEIYGDIKGASNSFNLLKAYQQGGLCVGRLVKACLNIKV